MRLARFLGPTGPRLGVVVEGGAGMVDLGESGLPHDTAVLLAGGSDALDHLRRAAGAARVRLPMAEVRLLAPVPRPPKLLAIGLNYPSHVEEGVIERPPPEHQLWFNKQATCVIGPGEAIHVPRVSEQVDYEGELAFVVGRRCRHVPAARAAEVVAGWTVINDVSVRDWQRRTPTLTMGKSFDTHGPLGPWLVTADELGDPHGLGLRTWVNGDLRQDASTGEVTFGCWEMVEHLSTAFTLEPGDVVATGTPAGVGAARTPPAWLRAGDVVRIEIEGIGALGNPVVDEPAGTIQGL